MGPITLVDKSAIQALAFEEVTYLDRYYSLVISPILMRELLSTLAKEPEKGKDWEKTLSILASKVDTLNSYIPPNAGQMARSNLLGNELPMDGRIPLADAKRMRYRDGTQGLFLDEPGGKKILRDWKQKNFTDYYRDNAAKIREVDHGVDLCELQRLYSEQLGHIPDFKCQKELITWLDETYFLSATPEFHFKNMAMGLLSDAEYAETLRKFQLQGGGVREFAPYAFFYYRVNTFFLIGLGKNLISISKSANLHLDIQYVYYLPFSMCFLSSDKMLLEIAGLFKRDDQTILSGEALKADLKKISAYFTGMSPEHRSVHQDEFGSYPPEIPDSLTASIWKQKMRPRPPEGEHTIKLSKDQEKSLLEKFRKMSDDAVPVDEEDLSTPKRVQRPKLSIHERNKKFFQGVFEMLGMLKGGEWADIKRSFSGDHVRKIYDLHADLWHPDDDFQELAAELSAVKKLRVLYLGDVESYDITDQIWRFSLHFDQILIPDPFQSAWSRKEEFNQIAKPDQYLDDTLMLLYSMVMLQPLIETGQVLFVPDPADFKPTLKMKMMEISERKADSPFYSGADFDAEHRGEKTGKKILIRTLAQLPVVRQRAYLEQKMPPDKIDGILKYLNLIRQKDVGCVDRDVTEGQLFQIRSGANFESSLLLSAFYAAIPVSSFSLRAKEYLRYAAAPHGVMERLAEKVKATPNCRVIDSGLSAFVFSKGAYSEFRNGLLKILNGDETSFEVLDALFADLENEIKLMAEFSAGKTGVDADRLLERPDLRLLWSAVGFLDEDAKEYISSFDKGLLEKLPKYFIGLPPTNVPDDLIDF